MVPNRQSINIDTFEHTEYKGGDWTGYKSVEFTQVLLTLRVPKKGDKKRREKLPAVDYVFASLILFGIGFSAICCPWIATKYK